MFADRTEAGRMLGEEFAARGFGDRRDVIVLGIPRGGVEVAAEVARALRVPLDIVVARKVGAPGNPEFAVGAVGPDGPPVLGDSGWASDAWVLGGSTSAPRNAAAPASAETRRAILTGTRVKCPIAPVSMSVTATA